ncbi:pimeloyl-ACP methyl ester carboxylesterase [Arthrobacter sp. PvP023]|uniref:alpha/beta fold hydrolase n=1 Tax=Micrococcaceae TaxID=1268 RepID=UPI001AEA7243|nr:alpha/beta hydrolase [Arthrobacter sp. PvP023]MBP1136561.1 pimeloyl-ACP methyl ester carboxylesterase [Arthrobacter sp. PvP023]
MTRNPPSSAHYLDIDDRPGFVATFGEGRPIVCIHTAGQSGLQWRDAIAGLVAGGYQVIVPDLPGHGHSEEPVTGPVTDLGYYGDWIIRLIEILDLDEPYVVGCSIGGKIALDVAVKKSAKLAGVIAMAADAQNNGQNERSLRRNLEDAVSPSRTDRTFYGTLAACGSGVEEARRQRIAARHRREDPQVALSDLIGWARHDVSSGLSAIVCPVHLVVGGDDFWLDPEGVERTAAGIQGARYTLLPGIGHYPMEELPDIAERLSEWLLDLSINGNFRITSDAARTPDTAL